MAGLVVSFLKTSRNGGLGLKDSLATHRASTILRIMRKRFEIQLALGKTPIERVVLPVRSRDELPPMLAGLQWIFQTPELNGQVFELLEGKVVGVKKATGRPRTDLPLFPSKPSAVVCLRKPLYARPFRGLVSRRLLGFLRDNIGGLSFGSTSKISDCARG